MEALSLPLPLPSLREHSTRQDMRVAVFNKKEEKPRIQTDFEDNSWRGTVLAASAKPEPRGKKGSRVNCYDGAVLVVVDYGSLFI